MGQTVKTGKIKPINFFTTLYISIIPDSNFYYGTSQTGFSKKDGTDLEVFDESQILHYKTRETKMPALKRALKEALSSRDKSESFERSFKSAPGSALKVVNG